MYKRIWGIGLVLFMLACQSQHQEGIAVSGRDILVEGKKYWIKGICYHPVPQGSVQRSFDSLDMDLKLMTEAGINTIRVYEPIDDLAVLDAIHEAGIMIIIGFGYDQEGKYDIASGTFMNYVETYKDHEAILMWELGNEYNYHPNWFEGDIGNWYRVLNNAADAIHKLDNTRPVTTAHGELPNDQALIACPSIDVWGMNVYRWDDPETVFEQWKAVSDKPMYLSEAGGDSYMTISKDGYDKGVNQKAQADANAKILETVFNNQDICAGVTLFSFTDGWWKAGNPLTQDPGGWAPNSSGVPYDGTPNEEYWGIVDIERNKKLAFEVVKRIYN
ncbi:glycoside hydrolase family 2 TIM barrel-domain containing protein [Flagellimonas flava]|uniref:glycoside hydrolase family 2 TIM barrel-domain containing protein n=1 Tax=Flagellimonas flava TaxID=570519 RepID=UPI003D65FD9C